MGKRKQQKPDYMKKNSHKGTPCRRNKPIYYDEVKKNINLMLTPTALSILEELATQMKISRSEVIERWLRSRTITISEAEN